MDWKNVLERKIGWTWYLSWTGYNKMGNWKFFTDAEVSGLKDNLPAMLDQARRTLETAQFLNDLHGRLPSLRS